MRVDIAKSHGEVVEIHLRLSRRNIVSMLRMLDDRDKGAPALNGRDQGVEIIVQAQEDDEHYLDRPAGRMSWE